MPSKLEELERLATLRDRGVLTETEFHAEKSRLLDVASASSTRAEVGPLTPEIVVATSPDQPRTYEQRLAKSRAYEKRLWSFDPITNLDHAKAMLATGWFACWLSVGNEFLGYPARLWRNAARPHPDNSRP